MLSETGSFFFSICEQAAQNHSANLLQLKSFTVSLNTHLAQHAEGHVDGGQQGSKRRSHVGVERRRREAEHEEGSILGQVHALTQTGTRVSILSCSSIKTEDKSAY